VAFPLSLDVSLKTTYYGNYHYYADSLPTCVVFGRIAGRNAVALSNA
jgi:succinate dehydrogenase/fumarate reductase flavoprotein subunit